MARENGVLKVPVHINGVISLKFVIDSGASEVQISKDVFLTLIRAETIGEQDFLPGKTFVLADGTKVKSDRFILRSIKVGESTFSNIEASVGGLDAALLLGQSFLSRFNEWKIDNKNQKLILTAPQSAHLSVPALPPAVPAPVIPEPKTDPADPKSHPPYHTRLSLKKVVNKPFRLLLMSYDTNKAGKVESVQVTTTNRSGIFFSVPLGEHIPDTRFQTVSFEKKEAPDVDNTKKDVSELTIINKETKEKLVLVLGVVRDSPEISPESFIVLQYLWVGPDGWKTPDMNLKKGATFKLLPELKTTYKVTEIKAPNPKNGQLGEAQIQLPNGETITLRETIALHSTKPATAAPAAPKTVITITKLVTVQLRFGRVPLTPGTRVRFIGIEGPNVRVNLNGNEIVVPSAATDVDAP